VAYITRESVEAFVQQDMLANALDDAAAGSIDDALWAKVYAGVESDVHAYLEARFSTPFTGTIPATIVSACRLFAAEAIFARRGIGPDANPFTRRADEMRRRLEKIGSGELPLSVAAEAGRGGGDVIAETSRLADATGRLML